MSEVLRFHRWPIWTLGAQSGVMVGIPRRLKASLKPKQAGAWVQTTAGPGMAAQREGGKERGSSPPIVHHWRVVIGHQHVAAPRFDEVHFKAWKNTWRCGKRARGGRVGDRDFLEMYNLPEPRGPKLQPDVHLPTPAIDPWSLSPLCPGRVPDLHQLMCKHRDLVAGPPSPPKTSLHLFLLLSSSPWMRLSLYDLQLPRSHTLLRVSWTPPTGDIKCLLPTPALEALEPITCGGDIPFPEAKPPALAASGQQHPPPTPYPHPPVWSPPLRLRPEHLLLPVTWLLQAWEGLGSLPQLLPLTVSLWKKSCALQTPQAQPATSMPTHGHQQPPYH